MMATGNGCRKSMTFLELVLRGELDALVGVGRAVEVLQLAPEELGARHYVLRRIRQQVGRGVAARLERGIELAAGVVLAVLAAADRARILFAPVAVVVHVPAYRLHRFGP